MKNKTLILIATLFAFEISNAQQVSTTVSMTQSDSTSKTTATIINTGSKILSYAVGNSWTTVSVGVTATKVSGTMGGTAIPVASMDGVNYFPISRPSIAVSALRPAFSDTITWTSSSSAQTKAYVFTNAATVSGQTPSCFPYKYVGVKFTGTGTMVATMTGTAVFRHE